jgi:N6-adenosine-specific RNA methylase IME4
MNRVLVADPPWPTAPVSKRWGTSGQSASAHYRLMSIEEIANFELPALRDDAVLFLWRLANMQEEALRVCRAWGFHPYGELVWEKMTKNGKPWFGMGFILRSSHETCLIGIKRRVKPQVLNVRSSFTATNLGHSRKPDRFYEIVERLYPGPYVELFARRQRPGWSCHGDEIGKFEQS